MSTAAEGSIEEAVGRFEYLSVFQILICKEHGFGLRNLKRHLLDQHAYPKNVRDAIIERFGQLSVVSPEDVTLPKTTIDPIDGLQAPKLALRCAGWADQACGFISTSKERLARHCNEHGWKSEIGDREHWSSVSVQSFCPASNSPRWFVVKSSGNGGTDDEENDEGDDVTTTVDQADRQIILQGFHAMDENYRRELEIVDAPAETDQTGWWKKTGWIEHFFFFVIILYTSYSAYDKPG